MLPVDFMDTALQAAWEAGDTLLSRQGRPRELQVKGVRDLVTDADFAAQRVIVEIIQRTYPGQRILAEEGAGQLDLSGDGPLWLIDPLDGTTNYIRGFPAFSVSIGLMQSGKPVLGVIHDPVASRTFIGERGMGANLLTQVAGGEMQEIRASQMVGLDEAIIGLDWPRANPIRAEAVNLLIKVAPRCRSIRSHGSAALSLAYVAAGWMDGYCHFSIQAWDAAAGVAIVEAAGGRSARPDGVAWRPGDTSLIAGSTGVVEKLLELIDR